MYFDPSLKLTSVIFLLRDSLPSCYDSYVGTPAEWSLFGRAVPAVCFAAAAYASSST